MGGGVRVCVCVADGAVQAVRLIGDCRQAQRSTHGACPTGLADADAYLHMQSLQIAHEYSVKFAKAFGLRVVE